MNTLEIDPRRMRRARTRSLIQVAALCDKAGLLETFGIVLGRDLQRDIEMKEPVAALFKGLLELKKMVRSEEVNLQVYARQGLEILAQSKKK